MKKLISSVGVMALVAAGYLALSTANSYTPVATAEAGGKKVYNGTLYVAGMGGHFAVADVTIDPNKTDAPITVNDIDMLDIGGKGYPTHDARIDAKDKNTMYWSTYKLDTWKEKGKKGGKLHVGKSDLQKEGGNTLNGNDMEDKIGLIARFYPTRLIPQKKIKKNE